MSMMDPDFREMMAKQAAAAKEHERRRVRKAAAAEEADGPQPADSPTQPWSELDERVEEARRHGLHLKSAAWDGVRWSATFSRKGFR